MLTGKKLFNTLLTELNEMGLPGMSATLDEMYRSPKFQELDPLTAIAQLVEPEYQKKMNKRIQSRLRIAHLKGCPQELTNCFDSAERIYLPAVFCQVLFPEKSVGIPFFQQGIFPAFSGHYASLRMRACSIR